jgi:MFS family permease
MPRVRRRESIHLELSLTDTLALVRSKLALEGDDHRLEGRLPGFEQASLEATGSEGEGGTTLVLETESEVHVPFFHWFFAPIFAFEMRRHLRHAVAIVQAAATGADPPEPLRDSPVTPPAAFTERQVALIATVSLAGAMAAFASALFGQNADSIAKTYNISDAGLSQALAVTRGGVLLALVAAALADRLGRRRVLIGTLVVLAAANAVSALAPTIATFTIAQTVVRAAVNAAVVVGGIAVIEEAPESARAYAVAMLALASGAGFALSVILLPTAGFGPDGWRLAFGFSALTILLVPIIARNLTETTRFTSLTRRTERRGSLREVARGAYGGRFVLLAFVAFLTNVFSAPSAQLTNRYLADVRGFSSSGIALLRAVTNGVPGLFGILLGGRLAETRGRRPVASIGLLIATLLSVMFFLTSGVALWIASTLMIVAAASTTLAVGTMDAELFPTEARGTSNAMLIVAGVTGSVVGLLVAGWLSAPLGGLGNAIAICGIAPLLAAVFLLPRLPESGGRALDDVSPSEI